MPDDRHNRDKKKRRKDEEEVVETVLDALSTPEEAVPELPITPGPSGGVVKDTRKRKRGGG